MTQNTLAPQPREGSSAPPPTFAPHDQLIKEVGHQVPALACGSHCNKKAAVRAEEGTKYETCSWVTSSDFSHMCLLCSLLTHPSPLHSHQVTTSSWSVSLSADPALSTDKKTVNI